MPWNLRHYRGRATRRQPDPHRRPSIVEDMPMTRYFVSSGIAGILVSACLVPIAAIAAEPASVKVSLWDKDGRDGITLSTQKVKAGSVEFDIKNTSQATMHEFLITPWMGPIKSLPYDKTKGEVREGRLPQLAGVEDMKPGTEATLRLPMKAGHYAVFCNQPGHYKMGMVAAFDVSK
jgi:uncharacterized cupredoxin-like copper-binding protein